jgi:hypothetical protein
MAKSRPSAVNSACILILHGALTACSHVSVPPSHVPPEEAAWFKFPYELPEAGKKTVPGAMATAIQLAMDDFLPRGSTPKRASTPQDVCLWQRQSWDITASPGPGNLIWVNISLASGACTWGPDLPLDMSTTYAIDTVGWRVLASRSP